MSKFCPNCGNQMSDNAKFCMECGANLGVYTSGAAGIKDNVIQRSQVGAASVGKVEIFPTVNAHAISSGYAYACRICGSPASGKCVQCKTYICGKCLRKVYWGHGGDGINTLKNILSKPSLFCKECFETRNGIYYIGDSKVERRGYFTEDELRNMTCEKCKSNIAEIRCEHCSKIFCHPCYSNAENYCPFCGKSRKSIRW